MQWPVLGSVYDRLLRDRIYSFKASFGIFHTLPIRKPFSSFFSNSSYTLFFPMNKASATSNFACKRGSRENSIRESDR